MVFSSVTFLFLFFPTVFLLYYAVPSIKFRNILLTVASLFFYAWGEKLFVLLMIFSVLINWLAGLLIIKCPGKDKLITALAVIFNIGMLFAFKYVGFFVEVLNLVPFISIPNVTVHLPIGISFFTFQALSYVIDIYRDRSAVQKNFLSMLLYISFFPQLIAGPIVKYHDIATQLGKRTVSAEKMASGIRRFIIGLSKKLLLADVAAKAVDSIFGMELVEISGFAAWLGGILYLVQIYFDFSGYSDMAIGLGRIFGFEFLENFNYPYIAVGIRDFWHRWHISLSTWFQQYLYIPLGGNRKGTFRTYINLLIVFFATGLWHGANFTFIAWGMWHGLFMILERARLIKPEKYPWLARIYTLFVVLFGFIIFRADSLSFGLGFIAKMFTPSAFALGFADAWQHLTPYMIITIIAAVIGATPIIPFIKSKITAKGENAAEIISYILSAALFFLCILILASDTYSPFIYFRF